ncbi:MAG: nitroreductase family deazaflavin-dependent oxidoreductase [Deltaproteobacteria bacterium]|nr:MAG: nitroreductase family deazaflavin-dependent oxidoreductase [Deltaproteobacteria bacterium]
MPLLPRFGASPACSAEIAFFRMLNRLIEPRIRAGWGSPRLAPGGLIVLETTGRRSGRRARTPLAATRLHDYVIVSTFRGGRSQWVKNAAANPDVRYWLGGQPRNARALVLAPGEGVRGARDLTPALRWLAATLVPYTYAGWAFALLYPRDESPR